MKLVFISHDAQFSGGAQQCLFELLKGLKEKDRSLELFVVFPCQGNMIRACLPFISGYKIIRQPSWVTCNGKKRTKLSLWVKMIKSALRHFLYFKAIKPDAVITNTLTIPSAALASKWFGCKHIWFIHEVPADIDYMNFMFSEKYTMSFVNQFSRKVLLTSQYAFRHYLSYGISSYKMYCLNQAVNLRTNQELLVDRQDMTYTIALVGSFDSNKGQLELLKAIKLLTDKGLQLHCYLVGADDRAYTALVKQYIHNSSLDHQVSVIPYVDDPTLYFRLSDVALVCSGSEAFGRVTVEALKCGIPVIASNVGANPELIKDGYNGILYRKADIDDLAQKIELLSHKELRDSFKTNFVDSIAREYTREQFSLDFFNAIFE